jgi:hypothetical protein
MPLPDDVDSPTWGGCFAELTLESSFFFERCQRVDCAFPQECDALTGHCTTPSAIEAASGYRAVCANVDCVDTVPTPDASGRCLCNGYSESAFPAREL